MEEKKLYLKPACETFHIRMCGMVCESLIQSDDEANPDVGAGARRNYSDRWDDEDF
ncbi:MAG: hypothetical protein HUK02_04175 [Bacteroidaceae bacterium]|nr:hypothetical protein [Bacteroidaceae bacterium]